MGTGLTARPGRSALRRQGTRERQAPGHPPRQLPFRPHPGVVDAQPPVERASPHLERMDVGPGKEPIGLRRIHADEQAAAAAGADGHVSADEEREPTEHLLLGDPALVPDELSDPVGEILVEGHAPIVPRRTPSRPAGPRVRHGRITT